MPLSRLLPSGAGVGYTGALVLTTQPSASATSGNALAQQPVVTVPRAVAGIVVTASLVEAGAVLANATAVTDAAGVATFSGLSLTGTDGAYTLQFASGGWTTVVAAGATTVGGGGAAQPGLSFASDWKNVELGTSLASKTDAGKWNGTSSDSGNGLEVIASTGLNFPSARVLRVTAKQTAGGFHRISATGLPMPGEGESVWYRTYLRFMQPYSETTYPGWVPGAPGNLYDSDNHPIELGINVDEDVTLHHRTEADTQWRIGLGMTDAANGFNNGLWLSPLLDKDVTYRVEWQIARLTGDECRAHMRIYSASGLLLYGDGDLANVNSSLTLAANPLLYLESPLVSLGELVAGLNGLGGSYWFPSELHEYQGAFAMSLENWCGPYVDGEAD